MSSAASTTPLSPGWRCKATRIGTGLSETVRPVEIAAQEEHERVISNGFDPRVFSTVGNVVVNCT
jgi:hypothetical protein